MKKGVDILTAANVAAELEETLLGELTSDLSRRGNGHCARVCDLDRELMLGLCRSLRRQVANAQIFVLQADSDPPIDDLTITSTKLIELRNPLADGTQRPPLLVFVPNDLRVSSEDSFGSATFEQVNLGSVYRQLESSLLREMPETLRGALGEVLRIPQEADWDWADDRARCRFLLTVKKNEFDAEAAGAALCELGLVPDFRLLEKPAAAPARLSRNMDCVRKITYSARSDRGRVLELGLRDRDFRNRLSSFFADSGTENPRVWTKCIATEPVNWSLSFDKWAFEEGEEQLDEVFVEVEATDLPVIDPDVEDKILQRLVGQQVLVVGAGGLRRFGVTFRTSPVLSKVQGLGKFQVQVISVDAGPVGLAKTKKAWNTNRDSAKVSFTRLNQVEWDEGWHFVRVIPLTDEGDPIPLVDEDGNPLPWGDDADSGQRPNESERFYVFTSSDISVEPEQRSVPRHPSVTHALLDLRFSAVLDDRDPGKIIAGDVQWSGRTSGKSRSLSEFIEAKFGKEGAVHVVVSRALKNLEQRMLASPDSPVSWRMTIRNGAPETAVGDISGWPNHPAVSPFLGARKKYFEAIRRDKKELISQAADFRELEDEVADYASAFQDLLKRLLRDAESAEETRRRDVLTALRRVLALDSVLLEIFDHAGEKRRAVLMGPTHPLRALWLSVWTRVGGHWIEASRQNKSFVGVTRDALLQRLGMASFPLLLPASGGFVYSPVESLHPFWTLYAPHWELNPRGLVSDVCAALGLPDPGTCGSGIDGAYLAERVRRYLAQHPYVRVLSLNVFNPGSAQIVVDMLLCLQKDSTLRDLRYDIRVFVPDPEGPGVGEAFRQLLSPGGSISGREADAFASPSGSHLYPKLNLAFRRNEDFRDRPASFRAHMSMLFDVFSCEEVAVSEAPRDEATAPVHGLVQDLSVHYEENETAVMWEHQPRHGVAARIAEDDSQCDLLASLPETVSNAVAVATTGQPGLGIRPKTVLRLDADDRALLHQVHEVCDWVFTVDRHLGIEFFDHSGRRDRPDYLIDHSPDVSSRLSRHALVTSRSLTEVHAMAGGVLKQHGFEGGTSQSAVLLDQLRALSGRLALKLISSSTQRSEAMGLGLARLFLEYQGAFANQIVVPLDSHLELYHELGSHADDVGENTSWRRTDLALFDLNANARTITCNLVEVKCYREVGSVGAFNQLKGAIAEQLSQSEKVLRYHFDPEYSTPDRPDRLLKCVELVTLLEFYLDRGTRFELIPGDVADEARFLLRTIEDGYRFLFSKSAVVFDFEKPGTEPPDFENGIEFHRLGIDLIKEMMTSAESGFVRADTLAAVAVEEPSADAASETQTVPPKTPTTVPKLKTAAFLVQERDRTVSWEERRIRRSETHSPSAPTAIEVLDDSKKCPASPDGGASKGSDDSVQESAERSSAPDADASEERKQPADEIEPAEERPIEPATDDELATLEYDVVLGVSGETPQCGLLGEVSGRKVAIDLNQTHTISLFGVQGGGKSYTLGSVVEMASLQIPGVNRLRRSLATVIFHYSPTQDYAPEFTSMREENDDLKQLRLLADRYGASPQALEDIILLTPRDKLDARRAELPGIDVRSLSFSANELQASHWRFLMGAVGSQATYIRQLNMIMRGLRGELSMENLRQGIDQARMSDHLKELAMMRLDLASQYIDDSTTLGDILRPGRLVIVDLRDEFIEKDEALGLFVVLLQLFADTTQDGHPFNKLVVFDEAHKYVDNPDLVAGLVEVVREMRHKGTSIMVASQDPPSVPVALIELSSQIILHRFNSPAWLKHIQKANAALSELTPEKMAHLGTGEAYVWSSKASDSAFSRGAVKIQCRPRVTKHGGATRTAVND